MDNFNYRRRQSSVVHIGNTPLGGEFPIRVQTMGNVSTMDTEEAVKQSITMIKSGAEYIRFTAQGEREARNLGEIKRRLRAKGYDTPLVADIHFNPKAAETAAREVEKVRINPGNYVDKTKTFSHIQYTDQEYAAEIEKIRQRFIPFLQLCKENHTAIRIGVNHGSLSDRIMSRYGDTPEGMVASCMEFLRICREEQFPDVVISIKASNTVVMVRTVRLLVKTMEQEGMRYPLHLGVTEAGEGEDGRIKSAVGIGTLLMDGIGDTIRVSLSEEPEVEIPVARKLIDYIEERKGLPPVSGKLATGYNPVYRERRKTRAVLNIGDGAPPVVISDRRETHFEFIPDRLPDYIYIGQEDPENFPDRIALMVDAQFWKPLPNVYPFFIASEIGELDQYDVPLKFLRVTYEDLTEAHMEAIRKDPAVVLILSAHHPDKSASLRASFHKLIDTGCDVPAIIQRGYREKNIETLQIKTGVDFGQLLLDGFQDGIMLTNHGGDPQISENCMFGILQATRTRISKTEYISCPGCGRTLYDLQSTIARVKSAISHLKGLKIGIMGCIVNGPGEMADADYGYVGSGRGKIDLYKGKECIRRNVPENEAVQQLVELIKENGDWHN